MKKKLITLCGWVGLIGCVGVIVADFIGIAVVESHNPISETISNLAITEYAWIQDIGLDMFATGLIACAIGLSLLNLGGFRWKASAALLLLLGIDVFLIAEHNKYAGREGIGAAIHIYLVYALGILFAAITFLAAKGLQKIGSSWQRFSLWIFIIWTVCAPIFFVIPTGWDGAYERFVAMIMVIWVVGISWLLTKNRRNQLPS